ncbi:MAG: 1-acyl-sn-glycerol-3-phosphate acyltransferase [Bacteroidales bacterium]|nr:1-acyl-sn-glycerol-3-phosphate acyltransferase [Bacteroidales bacterium]
MRKKKKIQDFDFSYALMKILTDLFFRQYYRKIHVEGAENIPRDKRVILAPNHQNALMDALVVLVTQKGQPVFLARADVFKNKRAAQILEWLNILPVYRMRDGRDELGKNNEIFDKAVDVLRDKVTLCLMPEGAQSCKRMLLPLVKGMFRIAFSAQEGLEPEEVVIVPVGIEYEDYVHKGVDVSIRFGKPIFIMDYMPQYREHQPIAMNHLRRDLSEGISALIQNIRSETFYDDFYGISLIAQEAVCTKEKHRKRFFSLLDARQKISATLDAEEQNNPVAIQQLCSNHADYRKKLSAFGLKDFVFGRPQKALWSWTKGLLLLLTLPLFVAGWVANFIPSFFPRLIVNKKLKSDQFRSSFHLVLRLIMYSVYYLLAITVLSVIFKSALIVAIACVSSLLLSRFVLYYRLGVRDIFQRIRAFLKKMKNPQAIASLKQQRKDIVDEVVRMVG